MNSTNATLIKFVHPDGNSHIESIKTDTATYYLSLFSNDLLLICKPFDNTVFTYPIENTMVLARVATLGIDIDYDNGRIYWNEDPVSHFEDEDSEQEPIIFSHNLGFKLGETECPICYEDFESGHIALCGHGACTSCLKKMGKANLYICPICRSNEFKWVVNLAMGHVLISC